MTKSDEPQDKSVLRAALGRERAALSHGEWSERSQAVVASVERYLSANPVSRVALYAPIEARREVDVRPLDEWLRSRELAVAYPVIQGTKLGFSWVRSPSALTTRGGFLQPSATSPLLAPGDLDLIIVPALAATPSGFRLGYGSGFYDRALGLFCPPATSLCVVFASQVRAELPIAEHDVACNLVITEHGVVQ